MSVPNGGFEQVESAELSYQATFGAVLRIVRKQRRLRQLDLADLLFVDHSLVSRWETGSTKPSGTELARIADALRADDTERELLNDSWARENRIGISPSLRLEELELTVETVKQLRSVGRPQLAFDLARRDARNAILRIRQDAAIQAPAMFGLVAAIVFEETKAALDFVTPQQIRSGFLSETQRLHATVIQMCDSRGEMDFHVAREGVLYGSEAFSEAHDLGRKLIADGESLGQNQVAEILRAEAINSGLCRDVDGMRLVQNSFSAVEDSLDDEQRQFVTEGVIRGLAHTDPRQAVRELERHEELLNARAHDSPLRWIQFVRTATVVMNEANLPASEAAVIRAAAQAAHGRSVQMSLPKYADLLAEILAEG